MLGAMFGLGFTLGPALGGFLASFDLRWPFWVAGTLSLINLIYGIAVLPESLPAERRRPVAWWRANPFTALRELAQLRGVGLLLAVLALSSLAQFILHTTWVLYTQFRFQWGPFENGWSLFVVGLVSVLVQGVLLRHLLARWGAQRLALIGLVSGTFAYLLWGLSTQSWMMYVVIGLNLLGFSAASALQSIVSNAASAQTQGQTLGAVSSLNSLMLVFAPLLGGAALTWVSHLPPHDWRLGAPFFLCAALQGLAAFLALRHFSARNRLAAPAAS
jgi:MFS transporter, DHA1 family, tetracycline resistance protein